MKTLLIDNTSKKITKLCLFLESESLDVTLVQYDSIPTNVSAFNLIVLSGSSHLAINSSYEKLSNEIELFEKNIPIIGICFGFELIAKYFGCTVTRSKERVVGIHDLEIVHDHFMFKGLENISIYETHKFLVDEINPPLVELAKSNYCSEIIMHKSRPIYGFQFHPETMVDKTQGEKIFRNLIKSLD